MAKGRGVWSALRLDQMGLRVRLTLLLYLLTFFSMGVVGYFGYSSAADAYRAGAKDLVIGRIAHISDKIDELQILTQKDLSFFSNHFSLIQQQYWLDMKDIMKYEQLKVITVDTWLDFARSYDYLYKIRFIGLDGRERITIRRDPRTRQVSALPSHELQDKSDKTYFRNSIQLPKGAFYAGSMDLNRERGRVEKPLVPVVRLAHPVFGENNVRYGVVVFTLFADAFFHYISDVEKTFTDGRFYLIDEQGEFFYHADKSKTFSHLFGGRDDFRTLFPGVLKTLQEQEEGALFAQGHVIGFKHVFQHTDVKEEKEHHWIIVGTLEESIALSWLTRFKIVFFSLVLLMLALVFFSANYYVDGLMRPLLFVTRQLQRLGKGQVESESVAYHQQDEIRQMLDSTERLINNMEVLANQADTIAKGDLSSDVGLLSNEDRLGNAINNMTAMLRQGREEADQQNWLKDGIGRLSEKLTGDLSPQLLAEQALSIIGEHLGAGRGVFYVYNPEEEVLELLGSYMFTQRTHLSNRFHMGEGAVGQAARERKPILLTIQAQDEAAPVTTGTARVQPLHTYTWPLLREGELIGVVELSGFEPLNERQQAFLDGAISVVTSFIFMALQRERIANLLKQTEESAQRAEEQSRQLQESNAQMEEQQQQLQQQTEELQQTNAQMEEQQQQLQQQTEELQQANAQMEEQQQQMELQSEELRRNNEALQRTQEDVNARARQLEEANRYKSDFLANMSHELRTPLNSIIVISKMMANNEDGKLDEETVKRAQVVYSSGNDLLRLISDILDLSKIEAGRIELLLESFPTAELAGEVKDLFQESFREKKIEFVVVDEYQDTITSDRHKIVQVLRNLLSNAFKFTQEGQVALRFQPSGDAKRPLRILVSDTGIGIPEDKVEQIFEEFRQVDGSISREYGGTGLGLSITKKFVELLGGTIEVRSTEGNGSEFILLLPKRLDSPHVVPAAPPSFRVNREEELNAASGDAVSLQEEDEGSILVIDDDPDFLENIALIDRDKGRKTLSAMTGEEGLTLAKSLHPAGVILDLGLPDMRGEEVLDRLKTDPDLKEIPVYIISARDKDQTLLDQGAIGYLQKPVTDEQIESAEAALLRTVKPGYNTLLVIEGPALRRDLVEDKVRKSDGRLVAVDSAVEGLELVSKEAFDLVLVDHDLSDMDCAEFCEKLQDRQPSMPIIIYGASKLDEERLNQLSRFTDSVIQQAPQADRRIFRDIERFLTTATSGRESQVAVRPLDADKTLSGWSVLVVDDDSRNLFVLTASLEQSGAKVISALNGRKALELLKQERVDLIFMDIMMPEMNGYEAIEAIRADPALKALPIIALTAKALKEDRQKCLDAGADDYLSKPVDYEVMVNMALAWIERRS
ncbi:MAG: response regulator [Candidatus Thiodiazotropha sp. (ex Dulcina madagascariensis)]|nr:response regulator [Candidatus Thiodiazotropha sp. (ex Dulcina madagascariensis)]